MDSRPPERLGVPIRRAHAVDRQRGRDRQRQQTDPLDVLEQRLGRQRGQAFLRVKRLGDVVVGDVDVRGDVGRCDGGDFCDERTSGARRRGGAERRGKKRRKRSAIYTTLPHHHDSPNAFPSLLGVIGGLNASSCLTFSGTAARVANASAVSAIVCGLEDVCLLCEAWRRQVVEVGSGGGWGIRLERER
jgi:hypothetical protein